jgi:hypothetical protein
MDPRLTVETECLTRSWMRHSEEMLRDYLVADIHDPRINLQSIQGRHSIIEALFGDRFAGLQEEEIRFAAVMAWLRQLAGEAGDPEQVAAVRHALNRGADDAEGLPIPRHVLQAYARLPQTADGQSVPNYIAEFLRRGEATAEGSNPNATGPDTFLHLWRCALRQEAPQHLQVLEPACGSANDYRSFEWCGLARLIDYTGFDLCEKNVANARAMFPSARFELGNLFETPYADKSFDCGVVHDLLEHFSVAALEVAVQELCRVIRQTICVGFFQMHEGEDHVVRPVDEYHFNTLSLPRVRELFARHGGEVQAIHLNTFLARRFGCENGYYDSAYTLRVRF